jgi:hypothetical protein
MTNDEWRATLRLPYLLSQRKDPDQSDAGKSAGIICPTTVAIPLEDFRFTITEPSSRTLEPCAIIQPGAIVPTMRALPVGET